MLVDFPLLAVVDTVDEAIATKRDRPDARVIGGGTEVIADQNLGLLQPSGYISIARVTELQQIEQARDGLRIGAGIVVADFLAPGFGELSLLLRRAARTFGTRQIRNRATVGGNVASGLPDRTLIPCLLALEATVQVRSTSGERTIPIADFLTGGGETALAPVEIVTGVTVPQVAGYQNYTMVGPRNAQFFATVSVALVVDLANRNVRLGLGNAADRALRSPEAEAFANDAIDWNAETVDDAAAAEFGRLASMHCDPPSDVTSGADYRRHAIGVMAKRVLTEAFEGESQ